MANEVIITRTCRACNGTGIDSHYDDDGLGGQVLVEQDCEHCNATGLVEYGTISGDYFDDVMDKLGDLEEKVNEIKDVVDEL